MIVLIFIDFSGSFVGIMSSLIFIGIGYFIQPDSQATDSYIPLKAWKLSVVVIGSDSR